MKIRVHFSSFVTYIFEISDLRYAWNENPIWIVFVFALIKVYIDMLMSYLSVWWEMKTKRANRHNSLWKPLNIDGNDHFTRQFLNFMLYTCIMNKHEPCNNLPLFDIMTNLLFFTIITSITLREGFCRVFSMPKGDDICV